MSLAFLILAHRKAPQVERLFNVLHHRDDFFVLHFDRRSPAALHALGQKLVQDHPNVRLLPAREINWGGPAMAEVQLAAMKTALHADPNWTHFINLTGQDFPLKSREEMLSLFAVAPEKSYLSWFDPLHSPALWRNARERMLRYHLSWPWLHRAVTLPGIGRRLRRFFGWQNRPLHLTGYLRTWPDFFHYYGGANHVALARVAARYLVENRNARRITRWLHAAGHSDEILFQSVLLNSPLAATLVNETLREIDFPAGEPHPRIFTSADLPRLLSSPALFARKFDESVDAAVLTSLEERLQQATTTHS